ncbi:hypothetical protein SOVF_057370 [Spinacia oleracea]|nr:hypothetical protein SOVF_057370 [Spinacia oleracea]
MINVLQRYLTMKLVGTLVVLAEHIRKLLEMVQM